MIITVKLLNFKILNINLITIKLRKRNVYNQLREHSFFSLSFFIDKSSYSLFTLILKIIIYKIVFCKYSMKIDFLLSTNFATPFVESFVN